MRLLYSLLLLSLISCMSTRDKFTYSYNKKKSWLNSYKYQAFYGCIKEGIGNDSLRIILKEKDLFAESLDMDFSTIDSARALGQSIILKMPKPHIKIDKGEESLSNKNFISFNCLNYYSSRELDLIANRAYKQYIKDQAAVNSTLKGKPR